MTKKQGEAWDYLHDNETLELLFGGGAGGGKSHFGCGFIASMALRFPKTRYFIAREELKTLKESTLLTMFEVLTMWGLKEERDYKYYTDSHIHLIKSGSDIYLKELAWKPGDPNYDRLGSTEYTAGFIDEANQVRQKAKNIMRSRIRYKLALYGLTPKLLMSCNPDKGYLYAEFYKPAKEGKLHRSKKFVKALVYDNPHIDPSYVNNLLGLDLNSIERLLRGNWEYDADPAKLIDYNAIVDLFTNILPPGPEKYITADIARQGTDRTVLAYWEGFVCKRIAAFSKLPLVPNPNNPQIRSSASVITEWREQHQVPLSHVIVDEDGMGGGVRDYLGCKGFIANSRALKMNGKMPNYSNLKSQCYYELAKKINRHEMIVHTQNETIKAFLMEELEQVKGKDIDKDKALAVIPKDEVKENIGRSPDFSDTIMMRMQFEFVTQPRIVWI